MINLDGSRSLALQTSKGNDVPNTQDLEIPAHRLEQAEALIREQLGLDFTQVALRREATATYNCHGMTFACRRTGIYDLTAVRLVLADDGYGEVRERDVMPGDIVLYYEAGSHEPVHSGIVVAVERVGKAVVPTVLSKWGTAGEYVHHPRRCPRQYRDGTSIRFYREAQHAVRSVEHR
jgi:hypothetical protein